MRATLAFVLLLPQAQEDIKGLIEAWQESAMFKRDRAARRALANWRGWSDADLELLRLAGENSNSEVSALIPRGSDALILAGAAAGAGLLGRVEGWIAQLLDGPPGTRIALVQKLYGSGGRAAASRRRSGPSVNLPRPRAGISVRTRSWNSSSRTR